MAGITRPTRGTLEVRGRISALIELGAGFHPEISGRENVVINGIMLGLTRRQVEERFDDIVAFAGAGTLHRRAGEDVLLRKCTRASGSRSPSTSIRKCC
jgi:ABC-type polysaccharide/polyol phosphate transport system ATPase subunit